MRTPPKLTKRQEMVMRFLREFFNENDQLPPMTVTQKKFGYKGSSGAHAVMLGLEMAGAVERNSVNKYRFARPR